MALTRPSMSDCHRHTQVSLCWMISGHFGVRKSAVIGMALSLWLTKTADVFAKVRSARPRQLALHFKGHRTAGAVRM